MHAGKPAGILDFVLRYSDLKGYAFVYISFKENEKNVHTTYE
jgi:hypothetical protein